MTISDKELEDIVSEQLDMFYKSRLDQAKKLELKDVLSRKNPYLFKALGIEKPSEIVENLLNARLSSSDETIFGTEFFEKIAKRIAEITSNASIAPADGVDIIIDKETYKPIGIKSGENWGNSSQIKRLKDDFETLRQRVQTKIDKKYDPVVGHGYGTKNRLSKTGWRDVSGQAFWKEISGDPDLYLKLMRLMKDLPLKHKPEFKKKWDELVQKFTDEFSSNFCKEDGSVDWEKLTKFVSEEDKSTRKALMKKKNEEDENGDE